MRTKAVKLHPRWLCCVVLGLMFATSPFASAHACGIFQNGVYYLGRIAELQWYHLVDPAPTTVQTLRQAPIVLLTRFVSKLMPTSLVPSALTSAKNI